MKKSNELEQISGIINNLPNLNQVRDIFGIPSFCLETPLGSLDIICEEDAIFRASFIDRNLSSERLPPPTYPLLIRVTALLNRYFDGEPVDFSELPLSLSTGTDFQLQVWHRIQRIPYGEVRTYKWIAEQIGKPKAVRAVGNATGANPVSIVIPCHRVIGSNGNLGGYGGGIARKRQLLAFEGYPVEELS